MHIHPDRPLGITGSHESTNSLIKYIGWRAYGKTCAVKFEKSKGKNGSAVVSIDISSKQRNSARFDWKDKFTFQLNQSEIIQAAAVFLGFKDTCSFGFHGPDKDKTLHLKRQHLNSPNFSIYLEIMQGNSNRGIPIYPDDIFFISQVLLDSLRVDHIDISEATIISLIKAWVRNTTVTSNKTE